MVDPAADFPAAHSMDSGWFAVDKHGRIAHFSTGEGGAMPTTVGFTTGEAGDEASEQLLWQQLLPWMARQGFGEQVREHAEELYALFDTETHASAAAEALGSERVDVNPLFVAVSFDDGEFSREIEGHEGFVGYAPGAWDLAGFNTLPPEVMPIATYDHGTWEIPGHYIRQSAGLPIEIEVPEGLARMDTDFAEAAEIQLADFYTNEECASWSEGDLRDGSIPEAPPSRGFFGWLFSVLRGGS